MASITIENKGFNCISKSSDKVLLVNGQEVCELFAGMVTVHPINSELCEHLATECIPVEGCRVEWEWAVKQLVHKDKWYLYLSIT